MELLHQSRIKVNLMEKPSSASSEICGLSPLKMNVRDRDPLEEEDTGNGTMVLSMSAVSEGAKYLAYALSSSRSD
ncbi:hypothetical protein Tco_0141273 [Tanacetum coccineum]